MELGNSNTGKDRTKMLVMALITMGFVLLLVVPLLGVLILNDEEGPGDDIMYVDQKGAVTGDASMSSASREAWERYLETAPSVKLEPQGMRTDIEERDLQLLDDLPGSVTDNTDYEEPPVPGSYDDQETGAPGEMSNDREADDDDSKASEEREVEEADIVRSVGDRIYVLNNYMGFLSVNMEEPSAPYIEGRTPVLGTPVSMYIVDFLGFVIASNAPALDGSAGGSSGRLYILDLTDNTDPRIVKTVELDGYPLDSRRVGEVIYVVTNDYDYYYGNGIWWDGAVRGIEADMAMVEDLDIDTMEDGTTTTIVSISFRNPESLGEVDREEIPGDSGKIHASQFAIFIPQIKGDWDSPETKFTYVDISDPEGSIRIKGSITIPGYLVDRYQMDHYRGMFRVVTQENPDWEETGDVFPSSTLYVVDARDPDDMDIIADLLIDDEGNLMATRFEGDRAYTIHLPESLDPLDVIDLEYPDDPRLTDVLEIPGWVEHMEVLGYNIIAIGVDNEEGQKVALYLFDVNDPENAILEDRVVIGDGYTYSEANWDPKALTILEDEKLVVLPYSSYSWGWLGTSEYGVQLVSYDLEKGNLEARGKITGTSPVTRSRSVNGNLVTTSDRVLQSIDHSDPDQPVLEAVLDLATNVKDAFIQDNKIVSLIMPDWSSTGAKIRVSEIATPYDPVLELGPEGLQFEDIRRSGSMVFIKGIRQGPDVEDGPYWELYAYDMTDPTSPVEFRKARTAIPYEYTSEAFYGEPEIIRMDENNFTTTIDDGVPIEYVNYDPYSWTIIDGPAVAVYLSYYYYGGYYKEESRPSGTTERVTIFRWGSATEVERRSIDLPVDTNINHIVGGWDGVYIQSYDRYYGMDLTRVEFYRGVPVVTDNLSVQGRLIGMSDDMDLVYTALDYWWENDQHNTINVYDVSSGSAEFVMGVDLGQYYDRIDFQGDRIVVISQDHGYPYYYEDNIAEPTIREGAEPSEGGSSDEKVSSDTDAPQEWIEPEYKTTVHVIGLVDGVFETHDTFTVEGIYYSSIVLDDMVLLNRDFTLLGISLSGEGLEEVGPWSVHGYIQGGDVSGDRLVLAMGNWGIETVEL
ncbi:MAG: beta-propeller domain-containing protein [Candidatus Thermoplasmatota archaeon]|nr:beta-propeller domain-containing protein [Candidatus Thermoplasmatota archaeon]